MLRRLRTPNGPLGTLSVASAVLLALVGAVGAVAMLVSLARSWTARDVIAHLGMREPSTWSRTIVLGAEPRQWNEQEWQRHPGCGCCWPADSPASGTMEP